jgi:hypothetical protein
MNQEELKRLREVDRNFCYKKDLGEVNNWQKKKWL